jgi:hypothetical protein
MSALPNEPLPPTASSDRRRTTRLRPTTILPVRIGRGEGIVIDLGLGGLRVRHSTPMQLRSLTRVTILSDPHALSLDGEVLASRVVELGDATKPTVYETRLRFCRMEHQTMEALARYVATLRTRDLRRLVANLRGWHDEPHPIPASLPASRFIRLIRIGNRWSMKQTLRTQQPPDGFVLPGDTDPREIELLCSTWDKLDSEGRHLVQRMAAAVIEGQ